MSGILRALDAGVRVIDLGRELFMGMPQSPNHPQFLHSLPRRHGDMTRPDGGSAANDIIVMGCHVGTHIDALAHVSQDGLIHGELDAVEEQVGGRFMTGGVQDVAPMVCRGWLFDVPAALGVGGCEPGQEITPADLDACQAADGLDPAPGDVLLVRSGWGARWDEGEAYMGHESGVPGVSEAGARHLAAMQPRAVGADTIAFERLAPAAGHSVLPAHRILLVESGINIIETLALEELAATGVRSFLFILSPLAILGGTGSPVRPLAVIDA